MYMRGEPATVTRQHIHILNENPHFMALGAKLNSHFCGSRVFWKLGYYPCPMISFLELKLWLTNQ